jgi:NADPH:quinone reductase-like Zn-dependent oxidoreductase
MRAIIISSPDHLSIYELPDPEPAAGQVRVKIFAAALNRRDHWIKKGIYRDSKYPVVPGSDGAGIIDKVGEGVNDNILNKQVIINPAIDWGTDQTHHADTFQILGLPSQGTMAEYVCVPVENVTVKPDFFSFEKAAALPLAGLTAYRALFSRGKIKSNDNILITGAGGGVSMFMIKYAHAIGASVMVTSSSEKKIKKAIQIGATDGVLYTSDLWEKMLQEKQPDGFDLVIDGSGGKSFDTYLTLLKTGGKIVIYGGTAGKLPEIVPAKIFWKQASILGTTMGSPLDFQNMIAFINEHRIEPEIDKIFPIEDAELSFKHMENQEQFGKIVIKIS